MLMHIANLQDAPRMTVSAGEDMGLCATVKLTNNADGTRKIMKITAGADIKSGGYGIAWKVSMDPNQVTSSSGVNTTLLGSRIVTIKNGDDVVLVGVGGIIDVDVSLLDASLDPARAGALPTTGDMLTVKAGLPSKAGTVGEIATPMFLRCIEVYGGKRLRLLITDPQA